MYVHNLKQQPDLALTTKLLHLQETKIAKDNHRNISNYKNIVDEVQNFDSFELLLNDDRQIVAFSGLYITIIFQVTVLEYVIELITTQTSEVNLVGQDGVKIILFLMKLKKQKN